MAEQETILVADDSEINRAILRNLFEEKYNILEAENGEQALMLLRQYRESVSAVLLDLVMPVKDGYSVLDEMRRGKFLYHVPVVVITAEDSADNRVKVFELGASDVIAKPFEPEVVKSRVNNIIELGRYRRSLETLVEEQSAQVRESNAAVIDMLSSVIEYRSLESGQHIRRIRLFTGILLNEVARNFQEYGLNPKKIQLITESSSMHDIGKIAIPDSILNKPGKLTEEEFEIMKTHTLKGCEILSGLDRLQDQEYMQYAYQICRYHHERWDGKGYPDGLKGNSIPLCAQVVAVADCYDALTTDRVYKKAISPDRAFSMILNGECGSFSPKLLECFKNVREPFAQLAAEYADGKTVESKSQMEAVGETAPWNIGENVQEQLQQKYYAALRYADSTVMEADLHSGIYHLVYLQDQDFSVLRTGSSFEESIRNFTDTMIHPEERKKVRELLEGKNFFEEGQNYREWRYRILDRGKNAYVWCRSVMLRINLENPRLRNVLLIWHKEDTCLPAENGIDAGDAVRQDPMVNQLLGGILRYHCDQFFTIIEPSRSLVDLLGYSEDEIAEHFHNRLIELVYQADREKLLHQFCEQRDAGRTLNLEYRLVSKGGGLVWVSNRSIIAEKDGAETALGVLLDVTQSRQAEEELRLSLERHDIIMNQTNDIIFEWDIKRDALFLSSNWLKQHGYVPISRNVKEEVLKASHIHPDDVSVLIGLIEAMTAGVPYKEGEFRIIDSEEKYRWCKVRTTAQFDLDGKPFKAVGVILDIDAQKRESTELEERASRDVLTGLYNKNTAQLKIGGYLENCGKEDLSALMILDVDNFKQVNDCYGHMFGDAVLVEMAAIITGLYRERDIIARIGGDEFLIFMPGLQKEEIAEQRADRMLHIIQEMMGENLENGDFSCSIGLAFSHGSGGIFQKLFLCADKALYHAKAAGKNRCECYCEEMEKVLFDTALSNTPKRHTMIDSNRMEQWDLPYLITKSFEILYDVKDFSRAVTSILRLIGKMFGISRIYIYESTDSRTCFSNTFEWYGDGVAPRITQMQNLPYIDKAHDYRDNFGADGLFYCHNIHKLKTRVRIFLEQQNVLSTLQFAIRENGVFHGFVGFDDCKVRRLWTLEQINALKFIGKLMSVFLLKNRAQEALSVSLENLKNVLEHQEIWFYVLDPDTYNIRYLNERTYQLVPEARTGVPCYEVFYHRDSPCENCALECAKKKGHCLTEFYNPYLKLWILADASIVEWDRKRAGLIACRDISRYKTDGEGDL